MNQDTIAILHKNGKSLELRFVVDHAKERGITAQINLRNPHGRVISVVKTFPFVE